MSEITFEMIKSAPEVRTYIEQADRSLLALGYTEHSFAHVTKCAKVAGDILTEMGYSAHEVELVKIAAFMHDIGNVINRWGHAQTGALLASQILNKMGMPAADVALVITAIGYHDEDTAYPVNAIAAALILADKTDVRRTRVRSTATIAQDIHDRVNYAVEHSEVRLDKEAKTITLHLTINTKICPVMEYFEIFLNRMLLCRKAADLFDLTFKLTVNEQELM